MPGIFRNLESCFAVILVMKMRLRYLTLMCLFLLFGSCTDYGEELSGNYFYCSESADMKCVLSHSLDKPSIYGRVVDYNYNKQFIVVKQEPVYEQHVREVAAMFFDPTITDQEKFQADYYRRQRIADSIVNSDPYYQKILANEVNYWIIAHQEDLFLGPLTLREYLTKRKELNIPKSVNLD